MNVNLILNLSILLFSFFTIGIFALKGAISYRKVKEKITQENDFYTEIILGLESGGTTTSRPSLLKRETRIALWELYNNLRVHLGKETKSVVLHRKMLETKQILYKYLEDARVNVEILPYLGILGTLVGFAIPYVAMGAMDEKYSFQVTGLGFFFAAATTIVALIFLIYLKKKYESDIIGKMEYYEAQVQALEKILVNGDGFPILERWLQTWPEQEVENNSADAIKEKQHDESKEKINIS